jgi:hypothetical protein
MKQLLFIVCMVALFSCGKGKEEQQALTPEQENQMVDSLAQHLDEHKNDLQQKADSVNTQVDSLLKDI